MLQCQCMTKQCTHATHQVSRGALGHLGHSQQLSALVPMFWQFHASHNVYYTHGECLGHGSWDGITTTRLQKTHVQVTKGVSDIWGQSPILLALAPILWYYTHFYVVLQWLCSFYDLNMFSTDRVMLMKTPVWDGWRRNNICWIITPHYILSYQWTLHKKFYHISFTAKSDEVSWEQQRYNQCRVLLSLKGQKLSC